MIRTIIVDDERHCIESLMLLIEECCDDVEVIYTFTSPKAALENIRLLKPDLLFLDIEMPRMNGFALLEHLTSFPFAVIFTTGYDQYAIKAIRFSALDYLLKPIDEEELVAAIQKVRQRRLPMQEQFEMLIQHFHQKDVVFKKIAIPTADGFQMVAAENVIWCEATDNYTSFYLKDKKKIVACRTLKDVEEQLQAFRFFIRVHHSSVVNLNEISKYSKGEGGYVTMSDGAVVSVSRRKKDELMKWL